jgi:glycosyltransferase involved in cell wall biosynthesis
MAQSQEQWPDVILVTDMLNLPVFLSLAASRFEGGRGSGAGGRLATSGSLTDVPVALYFHENQLTYPLQPGEKRDLHYGFINLTSALRADALFFNSAYHLEALFDELPRLLKHFPDFNELWVVDVLRAKAQVLPLGLDLTGFTACRSTQPTGERAQILWNHRWEYDKDPETFFRAIYALVDEGWDFDLILLGESFRNQPSEFLEARERLPDRLTHFGYAEDAATYGRLLWQADIVVSTALHEFFGAATVEACYCGCYPILPNRLAYPELIPGDLHAACLYDNFEGLLSRLRHALGQLEETRAFSLQEDMARYDWQRMAPEYDRQMARLTAER